MRTTALNWLFLLGLGLMGLSTFDCGATSSSGGAMNDTIDGHACAVVGATARAADGCNTCICAENGLWTCTTVACGTSDGGGASSGITCSYNGTSYHPGDIFPSVDACNSCTCPPSAQVACTLVGCGGSTGAGGMPGSGGAGGGTGGTAGNDDGGGGSPDAAGDACCPSGWSMYGCLYPEGGTAFACHNPAMGCASSNVCGLGCDRIVSGRCDDAAVTPTDAGCIGPPPTNGCNICLCTGGNWICGTTQCSSSRDAAADGPAPVVCGGVTCGPGEWCDTGAVAPTCRCGVITGSCSSGLTCCINPLSGCGPAHCNEYCAAACTL